MTRWHAKKPEVPELGDAYFDFSRNEILVYGELDRTVLDDIVAAVDEVEVVRYGWFVITSAPYSSIRGNQGPQGIQGPSGGPMGAT